jgi:hypothetical protein
VAWDEFSANGPGAFGILGFPLVQNAEKENPGSFHR